MSGEIQFLLNDREVCTTESAGLLVLDYLRKKERLVGTKEGCKEGDCGSCVVLLGELCEGKVVYKPVTSCLTPLGELHGKHLVTIEGLNMKQLSPIQEAIVAENGSQCGFCTPGIVVSLTGYLLQEHEEISADGIKKALGGHLCRCTGYSSLKRAGQRIVDVVTKVLADAQQKSRVEALVAAQALPAYFQDIPARLQKLPRPQLAKTTEPYDFVIAGGTDIYVQKGEMLPDSRVRILNLYPDIKGVTKKEGYLHIGALTTFEEFGTEPLVRQIIPEIQDYNRMIASWQIRNRATLGANIVNASPIGDMTILCLAMDCTLVLKDGRKSRRVPLKDFFKGYKLLDKTPSEILAEILLPVISPETKINFEKVSKRKHLDIASVNSAMKITCKDDIIADICLSVGGVAPIPFFARNTCAYFVGKRINKETVEGAVPIIQNEISPIPDIRGSAEYKRLLTRQLLYAHFVKLFPGAVQARDFYPAA